MTISLSDAGKRFNRDWVFRHFNHKFHHRESYAIIGPNGSGKSTLLQVLSGSMMLSEGHIAFSIDGRLCPMEKIFTYVSLCAPYLETVEEMTLIEFLHFHGSFKNWLPGIDIPRIISTIGLEHATNKQIRYFSSGMKQRVKLAQCIFSSTPVVLLDEPCTNLDVAGIELYHQLISRHCSERLVVVSSNDEVEYRFCREKIHMQDYK